MVSALPDWPEDTDSCRQTDGMRDCIRSRAGTIGYLDAGYGVSAGLQEITIQNKFGTLLNSQDAIRHGGVIANANVLPTDPSDDFGAVSLIDQDGQYVWPITLLTYLYVRLDLSFVEDPNSRSLMLALIKTFYDPEYVDRCVEQYGFTLVSGASLEVAQKGIAMLEAAMSPESTRWTFEDKPLALLGAENYVISSNRHSFPKSERDENREQIQTLMDTVAALKARIATMHSDTDKAVAVEADSEFTDTDAVLIWVALVLGALGFLLGSWNFFQSLSSTAAEPGEDKRESAV